MTGVIADYEAERQAVHALFEADCARRIVLFRGASGSGKTTLLAHCQAQVPGSVFRLSVQMRGHTTTAAEVFFRAGRPLTWDRLTRFTAQVADLQGGAGVRVDRNWLAGINNHIQVALHAEQPLDREHRRAALTEAWFDDLAALPQPLVAFFDTYENATDEMKEWISGPFLARAAQVGTLRVIIAGQEIPQARNIEWGHCCTEHALFGVREARHWLPVMDAMGCFVPGVDDRETWLAGVCHALEGNPNSIMKILIGLPLREPRA